ncbi:putative acetyltransferase EpsM [Flavobacterium sp. 9AF]|uniref:acetyltransferase n=1 Tax=Flavobacterium sp. 9AF TaxID=2653142 RepID=UPI0012F3AA72|nr:acetyltransferase [Flavobacterium sp. 9AF]VXC30810.1 putative acetyltransferase EpsM [Flavobacterium sp. 9AF]
MESNYYIFGASGHAKVVLDILFSKNYQIKAIVDDNPKVEDLFSIPVLKNENIPLSEYSKFVIAIGNNAIRKEIVEKSTYNYFTAIHTKACVSELATIDEGTVVMPNAVINAATKVGKHCIINTASVVEHDCVISDFVHISPNASLAGNVIVAEGAHIGIGASIIQGITIGKWATIGAGAVIIDNIPDYAVVVGNPGKIIRYNENE